MAPPPRPTDAEIGPPLEGTEWVLAALPGAPDPPTGLRATLVLDADREALYGSTGCGAFDGTFRLTGARIALGVTEVAPGACGDAAARLRADYLEALRTAGSWRLRADTLELLGATGVVARFHP